MSIEPSVPVAGKTPGIVVTAFVLSLLGFICGLPALLGLILGIVGRPKAKASGSGVGLATAAIVIGALWLVGGVVIGVVSIASSSGSPSISSSPAPVVTPEAPVDPVPAASEPVQEEPVEDNADQSGESVSQANAREKAQSYLDYSAFSRQGLIGQLEYEGFSRADATYGVDALNVNWNEQAALKAQSYLEYDSFSRKGLIEQLEFEGFTQAEATYGVNAVGL